MKNMLIFALFCFILAKNGNIYAQIPGEEIEPFDSDSTIIFKSPRPLLTITDIKDALNMGWGINLSFGLSGFGAGASYHFFPNEKESYFFDFNINGAKGSDELEYIDYNTGQLYVPNKIYRLYVFNFNVAYYRSILVDVLSDSFKPYIAIGGGMSFIGASPYGIYEKDGVVSVNGVPLEIVSIFRSWGEMSFFPRGSGFLGIGATFGKNPYRITDFSIRYYIIPFGGDGLESVRGVPITNFGGLQLNFKFGTKF